VGCYIWYSEEGPGRAGAPPSPLLTVPNVTAHPSTASVPITVLLYDGPLLCRFYVAIKGLTLAVPNALLVYFAPSNEIAQCHCAWAESNLRNSRGGVQQHSKRESTKTRFSQLRIIII